MAYNADIPYNDLPLLPPKEAIENTPILKKTIAYRRVLIKKFIIIGFWGVINLLPLL
jgi:hypothetical protein